MKKYLVFGAVLGLVALGALSFGVNKAQAMTPTLSVSSSDSVQVTVYGDAYAGATLYYQTSGSNQQSLYLGTTNSSGYLSTTVSTSQYNITPGSTAYVSVNGQWSTSVTWPYSNGYNYGTLSLSQTNVSLSSGQTSYVTAYNNSGNSLYISNNTNSSVATATVSGNQISIYGNSAGSTTMTVCSQNYSYYNGTNCAMIYVTVTGSYYGGTVSLSQSSVSVTMGQSINVTVYGGTMPYSIYTTGTSNVFQAALAGNTLTISGTGTGSSTLNVCSSGNVQCATLYVTVNANYNYSNGWIFCANENQWCGFSGNQTVRYGANGQYAYRTFNGGVNCSNSVFGDPAFGQYKKCWYGGVAVATPVPTPTYNYNYQTYQSSSNYVFTRYLALGYTGAQVRELQQRLIDEEVYNGPVTGYFGRMTRAALMRYQSLHGLAQTGVLDVATRDSLNQ